MNVISAREARIRGVLPCFDRIGARGLLRSGPGPQGHSILESHLVHDHDLSNVGVSGVAAHRVFAERRLPLMPPSSVAPSKYIVPCRRYTC